MKKEWKRFLKGTKGVDLSGPVNLDNFEIQKKLIDYYVTHPNPMKYISSKLKVTESKMLEICYENPLSNEYFLSKGPKNVSIINRDHIKEDESKLSKKSNFSNCRKDLDDDEIIQYLMDEKNILKTMHFFDITRSRLEQIAKKIFGKDVKLTNIAGRDMRKKYTEDEIKELVDFYLESGMSISEVEKELNISHCTLNYIFYKHPIGSKYYKEKKKEIENNVENNSDTKSENNIKQDEKTKDIDFAPYEINEDLLDSLRKDLKSGKRFEDVATKYDVDMDKIVHQIKLYEFSQKMYSKGYEDGTKKEKERILTLISKS